MKSQLKEAGQIEFPPNTGEKIYMLPFTKTYGLPQAVARWQPIVDAMMMGIDTDKAAYLMVDQGNVIKGECHRRSGPHIDGAWKPDVNIHGHLEWEMQDEIIIMASDVSACCAYIGEYTWRTWNDSIRDTLGMSSDPRSDGDCSHIDLSKMTKVIMKAGIIYIGNAAMIHESLPVEKDCQRTVVRINVPNVRLTKS